MFIVILRINRLQLKYVMIQIITLSHTFTNLFFYFMIDIHLIFYSHLENSSLRSIPLSLQPGICDKCSHFLWFLAKEKENCRKTLPSAVHYLTLIIIYKYYRPYDPFIPNVYESIFPTGEVRNGTGNRGETGHM